MDHPTRHGHPYAELNAWNPAQAGEKITTVSNKTYPFAKSNYAYVLDWSDYMAPAVLIKDPVERAIDQSGHHKI